MPDAVLIAGPTASGKSALALAVAERTGGAVVNVDAMQLYRNLRILTARPSAEDEARVPHRLYGILDAAERSSAGRFLGLAKDTLEELRLAGRLPILVGGTGLYFEVLLQGIAAVPAVPEAVRESVERRLAREGAAALHGELAARDPETAQGIRPGDSLRIARALGVLEATGQGLKAHQRLAGHPPALGGCVRKFVRIPPREAVYDAVERRFDAMLAAGVLDEVAALRSRRLAPTLPLMRAHGVPELIAHLDGALSLDDAAARAKLNTRHYVKRQLSWARRRMADWTWLDGATCSADLLA